MLSGGKSTSVARANQGRKVHQTPWWKPWVKVAYLLIQDRAEHKQIEEGKINLECRGVAFLNN